MYKKIVLFTQRIASFKKFLILIQPKEYIDETLSTLIQKMVKNVPSEYFAVCRKLNNSKSFAI